MRYIRCKIGEYNFSFILRPYVTLVKRSARVRGSVMCRVVACPMLECSRAREYISFFPIDDDLSRDRFSERNVLRDGSVGAKGIVDTEQALFGGVRPLEVDTARRVASRQSARARHRRNRSERRGPAVENVRRVLGRPESGPDRESE